jgi:hypothetical protein
MENWGLITYRESRLLFDVSKSSQSAEQAIVEVIAHELAHMWYLLFVLLKFEIIFLPILKLRFGNLGII